MLDPEPIPTRASRLLRLKDPDDRDTWEEFHRLYRGLIFGVARRAGLNESEADEVVQDTLIAVARKIPEFHYDPEKDSFKGWLLQLTRWRIADQFRKRFHGGSESTHPKGSGTAETAETRAKLLRDASGLSGGSDDTRRTPTVERVPDPAGSDLTAIWDEEWQKNLLNTALARVKRRVNPAHYEIYYLHVILGKPVSDVRQALGVSLGQIYHAKHRVGVLMRKECKRLERGLR